MTINSKLDPRLRLCLPPEKMPRLACWRMKWHRVGPVEVRPGKNQLWDVEEPSPDLQSRLTILQPKAEA
jgi:hypothetical protein